MKLKIIKYGHAHEIHGKRYEYGQAFEVDEGGGNQLLDNHPDQYEKVNDKEVKHGNNPNL